MIIQSGYTKPIDKFSYVYEGCLNDDKLFIGGKKEMVIQYCKLFPFTKTCKALKDKYEKVDFDRKMQLIGDNPEINDAFLNGFVKYLSDDSNIE